MRPCCRSTRSSIDEWPCSERSPTARISATAARATCTRSTTSPCSPACAPRRPTPTSSIDDGADVDAAVDAAAVADAAVVVVGYTADDEGEFIGDPGIDLNHLFPPGDEPELAERFTAEIDALPPVSKPEHVRDRPGLGFSTRRRPLDTSTAG